MAMTMIGGVCAVCRRRLRPKRPGEPGPTKVYCSHACRQTRYRQRPGDRAVAELGLRPVDLLAELDGR
jgi:hypothetical protein